MNHQYMSCPHTQQLTAQLQAPHEGFFSPPLLPGNTLESLCFLLSVLLKATTQTAAAISGPSCRHVCSAAYLFKPAAGPGGPAQATPGASPACLRIHSHLRIKLLTLMLLVMLGPAPIFEPIKLQESGNIGHVGEKKGDGLRHDTGRVLLDITVLYFYSLAAQTFVSGCVFVTLLGQSNITWCHTYIHVGSWVNMYIFIVGGWGWREYEAFGSDSLKPGALTVKQKTLSPQGGGWVTHCLTVTWLLRAPWLLNLRGVEAWTPAWPPPDTFHLVSVCGTQREAEKKRAAQRRKESIRETSPGLSVRGQGSEVGTEGVCQVLSGADKQM